MCISAYLTLRPIMKYSGIKNNWRGAECGPPGPKWVRRSLVRAEEASNERLQFQLSPAGGAIGRRLSFTTDDSSNSCGVKEDLGDHYSSNMFTLVSFQ